jgi:hypothetical protein
MPSPSSSASSSSATIIAVVVSIVIVVALAAAVIVVIKCKQQSIKRRRVSFTHFVPVNLIGQHLLRSSFECNSYLCNIPRHTLFSRSAQVN